MISNVSGVRRRDDQGDPALAELVARLLPPLLKFAHGLTSDTHAAEDLVQLAFERSLSRWDGIESGKHEGYLIRTIHNLHIDAQRRQATVRIAYVDPSRAVPDSHRPSGSAAQADTIFADLLVGLRAEVRTVLVLRFYLDYSVKQTAQTLEKPQGTIRRLTHEGVSAIRSSLQDRFEDGV